MEKGFMGTAKAAEKWDLSREYVAKLCREGQIPGVKQDKHSGFWLIPVDARNPSRRQKTKQG